MIERKYLYILLDTLLVIGAIVGVATLGGGRWISEVVQYYQSTAIYYNPDTEPVTIDSDGIPVAERSAEEQAGCVVIPLPMIAEMDSTFGLLAASQNCGQVQGISP